MNISQLQYFVATVRAGSYTEAAQELFISPQAISKSVGDLEREFGVSLLARGRKEVVLTSFGELFYEKASEIVYDFEDLASLAQVHSLDSKTEGVLSVAVADSPYQGGIISTAIFDAFRTAYPDISLTLVLKASGSCLSAYLAGIVDAAIILGRTSGAGYSSVRLCSFEPLIVLSKKHPLAEKKSLGFEDLRGTKVARPDDLHFSHQEIERQFKKHRCDFTYVDVAPFIEDHRIFFENDLGIMFSTGDYRLKSLYSDIAIRPLNDYSRFLMPICLVRPEARKDGVLTTFESFIVKAFSDPQFVADGISLKNTPSPQKDGAVKIRYEDN